MYKPGDIVFTRGTSFMSKAIRFFSKVGGESRTQVNHVGIIVGIEGDESIIVEAVSKVKRHKLIDAYGKKDDQVAIFRPVNLTEDELKAIADKANSYVDRSYGYAKIFTHMLDWCIGGRYFFRRLTMTDDYPICSWLVAAAYDAANKNFGIQVGAAQPDDIWDFCTEHADKYECVRKLEIYR